MEVMVQVRRQAQRQRRQGGFTVIELLISMVVLTVGLGGVLVLFLTAIAGNSRSRIDTQAVQVSQTVLEALSAAGGATSVPLSDCAANSLVFTTAIGGSTLDSRGSIDWTRAQAPGYYAYYVSCGANGTRATYEVRWQISSTAYSNVKLINVSSRLRRAPSGSSVFFSLPSTLHTMASTIY